MKSYWLIVVIFAGVVMAACNPLPTESTRYNPDEHGYDPSVLTTPQAPAPIEGDFRRDDAARLAFAEMERPLLVFIYDDLCGNCIAMRPHIAQLEADYWGQVDVAYLERDYFLNLGYEVFSYLKPGEPPEFFFFDTDQTMLGHWQGAPPIDELRAALDERLAEG